MKRRREPFIVETRFEADEAYRPYAKHTLLTDAVTCAKRTAAHESNSGDHRTSPRAWIFPNVRIVHRRIVLARWRCGEAVR